MSAVKSILGVILGIAGEGLAIWRNLLLYTEATKNQLIGGGVVGFLAGMILGFILPLRLISIAIFSVICVGAIAGFDLIVNGERSFPGLVFVLYLLGFTIAASLSFLGTKLSERLLSREQTPTK
jgi:hypothetical protein